MSARVSIACSIAIVVLLGVITVRNALTYPAVGGYDASEYIAYARDLVTNGSLPEGTGVYHTPPGYPAVAGTAVELGRGLDHEDPGDPGQLVSAMAVIGTCALILLLARTLWPSRPLVWLSATAFFALLPTVVKAGTMFHPEALGMLLTAGALFVLAHMVRERRYSWWLAVFLGALLGLGQLVRAWSLWMAAVAVLVLVVVAIGDAGIRRRVFASLTVVVLVAAIIPSPWYAYQATQYANPVFNRTQPDAFLLARRPLAFYVDARVPEIVRSPWSGSFNDRFWPVLYAETWGDYFGIWSWGPGRGERTDAIDATLARQSAVGVFPTALALAGMVALLGLALTRPREDVGRLIAALPPVAAVASILFLSVAYPSTDGDTIKGTYALAAAPALALCFGFAFEVLSRRRIVGVVLGIGLVASGLAELPFLVW